MTLTAFRQDPYRDPRRLRSICCIGRLTLPYQVLCDPADSSHYPEYYSKLKIRVEYSLRQGIMDVQ